MSFDEAHVIQTTSLYRAANVSATPGDRVIDQLTQEGRISPARTPTGRTYLTPRDGAIVYAVLTKD